MSVIFPSSKDKSVAVVALHPGHRMFRVLVPPLRGEVEQVIGAVHHVQTARVSRIGVIDRAVVGTPKDADSRGLLAIGLDRAEIVLEALLARLERRAIVEVEV